MTKPLGFNNMARQTITDLIAAIKHEVQLGKISSQTEHHLRREFSTIGWDRDDALHAAKLDEEILRLDEQVRILKTLRGEAFGGNR